MRRRWPCGAGDHPRSRGVYAERQGDERVVPGSSPLARGLRRGPVQGVHGVRIIPARAGFTRNHCPVGALRTDHPRSRGVYPSSRMYGAIHGGSSPLARGLHVHPRRPAARVGIIPARAGFTRAAGAAPAGGGDHPRSRGVYLIRSIIDLFVPGSSPLARGLRKYEIPFGRFRRIIPARAGFTRHRPDAACGVGDHPRSRGVYASMRFRLGGSAGSSPLARGLLKLKPAVLRPHGIIPARAGFTATVLSCPATAPDHPRSRGVYRAGP